VYDALTTWRPYKAALSVPVAIDQLRQEVGRGWRSPVLVDEFLTTLGGSDV
jgi:response regulator RpfG family c-di-GMP phosphodiesterase